MIETVLIQEIISGNQQAFRQLVEEHQKMVVNTAMGMIHDLADAEDIAQEVFIEVYRSIGRFEGKSSLKTWIYRITITRSLNAIRDRKKNRFLRRIDDFFQGKRSNEPASNFYQDQPDKLLEESEKAAVLHTAIDALPENQRIAFTLSKYEDLSYKEIAEIMNLSISSVESLLFRARKNLQKKLLTYYNKI